MWPDDINGYFCGHGELIKNKTKNKNTRKTLGPDKLQEHVLRTDLNSVRQEYELWN